ICLRQSPSNIRVASWGKNAVLQVLVSATFAFPVRSVSPCRPKPVRASVSVDVSSCKFNDDEERANSLSTPSSSSKRSSRVGSTRVSSSESESDSDNETCDEATNGGWHNKDFKPKQEQYLGHSGLNVNIRDAAEIGNVISAVIGDDLIKHFTDQSNLYHRQNIGNGKESNKTLKWIDISETEMKKFLGLIFLMGQVRKDNIKDYWSTDSTLYTPVFPQTMSRNRFEAIWQAWHFSDNTELRENSSRLFKVQPVYEYFLQKFRNMYTPEQELSLDEGMIPWRGRLKIRTYNPAKMTKYGILVRMLCEAKSGYICNMDIYTAEGKKLDETIMSVLENNLNVNHHVYQDNFYNSVKLGENLLQHKTRICGTMRHSSSIRK
ncbi:hypothetical protein C0J52_20640, partial [Blattella germanica]